MTKNKKNATDQAFMELVLPDLSKNFMMQPTKITNASMSYNGRQMDSMILLLSRMQDGMIDQIQKRVQNVHQLEMFQHNQPDLLRFEIPIKDFGVDPKKYNVLKEDLANMAVIPVRFNTVDPITGLPEEFVGGFYTARLPEKFGRSIKIEIHRDIAQHFIDIAGGYTRYNKMVALELKGAYAKRLYMWISSWKSKGGNNVSIEEFRRIMDVVDKYTNYKDLLRFIIKPSGEKIKKIADCWFEVSALYHPNEKQPHHLSFKIISIPLNPLEKKKFEQQKGMIEGCLFNLGVRQGHVEEILKHVHTGNIMIVIEKAYDLQTTDIDRRDIIDPDAYYYTAMMQFIGIQF